MIVEELAARFGFSVEGVQKLRSAIKELRKAKVAAKDTGKSLTVTGKGAVVAAAGTSRLGTAIRTILGVFARLIVVGASLAAGVAAVGTALVVAGVRAARARREFSLLAKGMGTKAQNLETTTNFLQYLGLGDDAKGDTQKAVGTINDILKAIRAGGEEADEARKKFAGLKLDEAFKIDPKTGQMRDAAAVLLDIVAAYKQLQEQAGAYRKQADDIAKKQPRKASQLRQKALELDRKGTKLADESGIDGKLKVLLDEKTWKQITEAFATAAYQRPTTSNEMESKQDAVAKQAEEAGLKAGALLKGTTDRLIELGTALSEHVLPPVNNFLDKLLAFGKATGLIKENTGEKRDRESYEAAGKRAEGMRAERQTTEDLQSQADASQKRYEDSIRNRSERMKQIRQQLSPEASTAKMVGTAQASTDNRKYENIGNDNRQMPISIQQTLQQDAATIAAATKAAVLGAISTKGANTSTGALTAP